MVQKIFCGFSPTGLSTSATRYVPLSGTFNGDTSNASVLFPQAGTISKVSVQLSSAPGNGGSYTIYVSRYRPTTGDSSWSIVITDTATKGDSGANTFAVSAGDCLHYKVVPSTSPAPTNTPKISVVCEWSPTSGGDFTLPAYNRGGEAALTRYFGICGEVYATAVEGSASQVMPACTLTEFAIRRGSVGAGNTGKYTVMVNGVAATTPIEFTNSDGNYALKSTGAISVSIAEGDIVDILYEYTGTPSTSYSAFGLTFTPATTGDYAVPASCYNTLAAGNTKYAGLSGQAASIGNLNATESQTYTYAQATCTLKKLLVWVATAQGAGQTITVTPRKDGADNGGNIAAITFSNENGSKTSSGTEDLVADSYYDTKAVASAGAATTPISITYLATSVEEEPPASGYVPRASGADLGVW